MSASRASSAAPIPTVHGSGTSLTLRTVTGTDRKIGQVSTSATADCAVLDWSSAMRIDESVP